MNPVLLGPIFWTVTWVSLWNVMETSSTALSSLHTLGEETLSGTLKDEQELAENRGSASRVPGNVMMLTLPDDPKKGFPYCHFLI